MRVYGEKIMAVGFGLSVLGLGHFLPVVIPAAAIVLMIGVIFVVIDK